MTAGARAVAVFVTDHQGHFQRMSPLVARLARRRPVVVLAGARWRPQVEALGARLRALDGLEDLDRESVPRTLRTLSHAVHAAGGIALELAALGVDRVIFDTFSILGFLVGRSLGVPYVNFWSGHAIDLERIAGDPALRRIAVISAACREAVERLRGEFGLPGADPWIYLRTRSPYLNLFGEPPAFLDADVRAPLEPLEFFGAVEDARPPGGVALPEPRPRATRLLVSFGTVAWRTHPDIAVARMTEICAALGERPDVQALVSLGRADAPPALLEAARRENIELRPYLDQGAALAWADVFLTHHGLNSTHEAIVAETPMISYPIFWDQPARARICRRLGIAVPLTERPRDPVGRDDVARALDALLASREETAARLASARAAELETMRERDRIVERILAL